MYLDVNNLYGWAVSQYLSTGGFKWLSESEIDNIDLGKCTKESEKGLILEVDLEYPKELHESHNDYPLAAEKVTVSQSMLSNYVGSIRQKYNISLRQVKKYVLHYRNLQLYINLGLELKKVCRALLNSLLG